MVQKMGIYQKYMYKYKYMYFTSEKLVINHSSHGMGKVSDTHLFTQI
jgi:hypothetical protein